MPSNLIIKTNSKTNLLSKTNNSKTGLKNSSGLTNTLSKNYFTNNTVSHHVNHLNNPLANSSIIPNSQNKMILKNLNFDNSNVIYK